MKTKAAYFRFLAGLAIVAMIQFNLMSQEGVKDDHSLLFSNSYFLAFSQPLAIDHSLSIEDWMVDDVAFCCRNEAIPGLEPWMVDEDINILFEKVYLTDWMLEMDATEELTLMEWMVEFEPFVADDLNEKGEHIELRDWMMNEESFYPGYSKELVELRSWMFQKHGFWMNGGREFPLALRDWMLDASRWN